MEQFLTPEKPVGEEQEGEHECRNGHELEEAPAGAYSA